MTINMDPNIQTAQKKREEAQRLVQEAEQEESDARNRAQQEKQDIDVKYGIS